MKVVANVVAITAMTIATVAFLLLLLGGCGKAIRPDAPTPAIISQEQYEECRSANTPAQWKEMQCSGVWPIVF